MSLSLLRELHLQAHDGSMIPNHIEPDPTEAQLAQTRAGFDRMIRANAILVGRPTGRYNCHGLVFASRRTCIQEVDIEDLLHRDGYHRVQEPRIGDIIAYRDFANQIEHTGIVWRIEYVGSQPVVHVWSKWAAMASICIASIIRHIRRRSSTGG